MARKFGISIGIRSVAGLVNVTRIGIGTRIAVQPVIGLIRAIGNGEQLAGIGIGGAGVGGKVTVGFGFQVDITVVITTAVGLIIGQAVGRGVGFSIG